MENNCDIFLVGIVIFKLDLTYIYIYLVYKKKNNKMYFSLL